MEKSDESDKRHFLWNVLVVVSLFYCGAGWSSLLGYGPIIDRSIYIICLMAIICFASSYPSIASGAPRKVCATILFVARGSCWVFVSKLDHLTRAILICICRNIAFNCVIHIWFKLCNRHSPCFVTMYSSRVASRWFFYTWHGKWSMQLRHSTLTSSNRFSMSQFRIVRYSTFTFDSFGKAICMKYNIIIISISRTNSTLPKRVNGLNWFTKLVKRLLEENLVNIHIFPRSLLPFCWRTRVQLSVGILCRRVASSIIFFDATARYIFFNFHKTI